MGWVVAGVMFAVGYTLARVGKRGLDRQGLLSVPADRKHRYSGG